MAPSDDPIAAAAGALAAARLARRRFDRLEPWCVPGDEAAGYAVQDRVNLLLEQAGHGRPVGYKIGCTTRVMQEYMGIPNPCAGAIFGPTVHRLAAELRAEELVGPGVECELAVRLAATLDDPAGYDVATAVQAVGACCLAIEIVEDRYVDFRSLDTPTLIADDFFGAGCVLGEERNDLAPAALRDATASMTVSGRDAGSGRGSDILGEPLEALAWLATHAARCSRPLREGEIVLLGSVVQTVWLVPGDVVRAVSPQLGEVSLALA